MLRVSFSPVPECVEADCWNRAFSTPPRHQERGYCYCYCCYCCSFFIVFFIFNCGLFSENRLSLHNDISTILWKTIITTQRYLFKPYLFKPYLFKPYLFKPYLFKPNFFRRLRQNRPPFLCLFVKKFMIFREKMLLCTFGCFSGACGWIDLPFYVYFWRNSWIFMK